MMKKIKHSNIAIIGGGISGTALMFLLARYSDIKSVTLFEKCDTVASINSAPTSNSQTLHCGDIETNYTYEKAEAVRDTAMMVENYARHFGYLDKYVSKYTKMAIGVGDREVEYITHRYEEFKELYPYLELWSKEDLEQIEPKLIEGRESSEDIVAMGAKGRYCAVDFGEISKTFIENAKLEKSCDVKVHFNTKIDSVQKDGDKTIIKSDSEEFSADYVVVDACGYSLFLAHKAGYGLNYACLPIAGSYYFIKDKLLNSKVYTVQNPKLPFAALHADPDVTLDDKLRFGPTALPLPKLERRMSGGYLDFWKTLRFDGKVLRVLLDLMLDKTIRSYIFRNFLFETRFIREKLFAEDIKKIVPTITKDDLEYASGVGGLRPQVIDKDKKKLLLGEAKIDTKEGMVFNMTPSPGATSCLGNALIDSRLACEYLGFKFDENKFDKEIAFNGYKD
jgi:malate dehydrogenase (quinone)